MPKVDMSPKAITARLKLMSELRDFCLLLGTATIEKKSVLKSDRRRQDLRSVRKNSK
jgi:hypothetical protein